jgi:hypothetical protein
MTTLRKAFEVTGNPSQSALALGRDPRVTNSHGTFREERFASHAKASFLELLNDALGDPASLREHCAVPSIGMHERSPEERIDDIDGGFDGHPRRRVQANVVNLVQIIPDHRSNFCVTSATSRQWPNIENISYSQRTKALFLSEKPSKGIECCSECSTHGAWIVSLKVCAERPGGSF